MCQTAQRVVLLEMKLPGGKVSWLMCYIFLMSHSLLNVSKATESGKITKFDDTVVRYWVKMTRS